MDCPWMRPYDQWVYKRGKKREVPMEVLCLSLSRAGTASLRVALWELGLQSFHGFSMFENPPDSILCTEAMVGKFEGGRKYTKEDWDALFFDCNAVLDNPTSIFIEEMRECYPDAKVLMTVRDVDAWVDSIKATILGLKSAMGPIQWLLERVDPTLRMIFRELRMHNW